MSELDTAGADAPASETIATTDTATESVSTETPTTEAAPSLDDTLAAAYDKITNPAPRGPDGKFAAREAAKEPANATDAAATNTTKSADKSTGTETATTEPALTAPAIQPPLSWSADMKAKFATLPPEVQEYVAQRDKETHDAISRFGQDRKSLEEKVKAYDAFDQLIESNKSDFARRGITPAQAFASLLQAQASLDRDAWGGLVQIGRTYGIDLQALISGQPGFQQGEQAVFNHPAFTAMQQKLDRLESHFTEQQKAQFEQAEAYQKAEAASHLKALSALESQIAEFSKDKPHYASVEKQIELMIPALRAENPSLAPLDILAKAYEAATWANPGVR